MGADLLRPAFMRSPAVYAPTSLLPCMSFFLRCCCTHNIRFVLALRFFSTSVYAGCAICVGVLHGVCVLDTSLV
ncbi:hypothetical protein C8R45DRAFT_1042295 [Mycena sanguinolenta]|nr:hypothetical protein C8R45DRAFT_1042295 [Mycena sanguinolenta]